MTESTKKLLEDCRKLCDEGRVARRDVAQEIDTFHNIVDEVHAAWRKIQTRGLESHTAKNEPT